MISVPGAWKAKGRKKEEPDHTPNTNKDNKHQHKGRRTKREREGKAKAKGKKAKGKRTSPASQPCSLIGRKKNRGILLASDLPIRPLGGE